MTFDEYQEQAKTTAVYPGNRGIEYLLIGLCGETGELAELVKKRIRDEEWDLEQVKKEAGDVCWYLAMFLGACGLSFDEVAAANLAKLADRKARGVLHGSGDNR